MGIKFWLRIWSRPLDDQFIEINESLPFILSASISLLFCLPLLWLRNEYPESKSDKQYDVWYVQTLWSCVEICVGGTSYFHLPTVF